MTAECRCRLSQPTITHTHTHTRIASPFLDTGSGRASLVADFGVVVLAQYDPSYSKVVQCLPNTPNLFSAADTCAVLPLPLPTNHPLRRHHLYLDALTPCCIAGRLMRSGFGSLCLPQ
ncbi:hypothetical protein D9619_005816 [Psilocybe cf. subviscida]|uniref:Uncharacterized protein n=1 Tax=Psilocybe cf. subviscida TaxID=2480587 RepID=A0A8H5BW52_9AGAR|nr:hypothetical protein D9619_005816 [Psilocybe cf. subviscida]